MVDPKEKTFELKSTNVSSSCHKHFTPGSLASVLIEVYISFFIYMLTLFIYIYLCFLLPDLFHKHGVSGREADL